MKKHLFELIASLLIAFSINFVACSDDDNDSTASTAKQFSAIHNFTKYTAIGAGMPTSASRSARAADSSGVKLIGQNSDGTIEILSFDDETGAERQQTYYLSRYTATDSFVFMGFSEYSATHIETGSLYSHVINYLLDKHTGKMYQIDVEDSFDIGGESNGIAICATKIDGKKGVYSYSVEDNLLKVSLIVDYDTIPIDGYELRQGETDRYGNMILKDISGFGYTEIYIFAARGKKIKKIASRLALNINGIFYDSYTPKEITAYLNEDGDLVSADFVPDVFVSYYQKDGLINRNGYGHCVFDSKITDDEFFFWNSIYDWNERVDYGSIGKVNFKDSDHIQYNYEDVSIFPKKYKNVDYPTYYFDSIGKVLYISDDLSVITSLDVMKNEYTDVLSLDNVLRMKSTEKDEYDNVVITYIDNDLNTVNYYIDTDGNCSTTLKKPDFIVKYISPIE